MDSCRRLTWLDRNRVHGPLGGRRSLSLSGFEQRLKNQLGGGVAEFSDSGWVLRPDTPQGPSRLQNPVIVHFFRRQNMHMSVLLVRVA